MSSVLRSEKEMYWRAQIALFEKFSGSQSAFCRRHSLSFYRFRYWIKKIGGADTGKALTVSPFIPVEVAQFRQASAEFPDPRWLAELIISLGKAAR